MTDVLLIGSSIFQDWGDGAAGAFPGRSVVNAAVGGTVTTDWLPVTGACDLLGKLVTYHPAVVACYVGSNDTSADTDAATIADNVLSIADAATHAGAWFVYFSIIKAPEKRPRLATIDAAHAAVIHGFIHRSNCSFVDINPVFEGHDDYFLEDGVHLTPDAYVALGMFVRNADIYDAIESA